MPLIAEHRVIVVGAGVGGLVAAGRLAANGLGVTVVDSADGPGGKMRRVMVGGTDMDTGPTVLTMRDVLEQVFEDAGAKLRDHVVLTPAHVLARHAWSAHERLDLFCDADLTAAAIGELSGPAEAHRYLTFCRRCSRTFETLDRPYIRASRTGPIGLTARLGLAGLPSLRHIRPFGTLWSELSRQFRDPRLRQLLARYATYNGSSPFLAPATLMLIAHVERIGVWLVEGGMHRIAHAMAMVAEQAGTRFRYATPVARICIESGRVTGVELASGERLSAAHVIFNGDGAALASGLLGPGATAAVPAFSAATRSLSALTLAGIARVQGFPLVRHNVFFGPDSAREFREIFRESKLPSAPTVYVCAQDRGGTDGEPITRPQRLLIIVNAPATGDQKALSEQEIDRCRRSITSILGACGMAIDAPETLRVTTPNDFARTYPGTGGALYGRASHGWQASFLRPGARTRIRGLYLAGGSTHPGAGVPMAALSGRQAAISLLADLASTGRFHPAAMPGGISTR